MHNQFRYNSVPDATMDSPASSMHRRSFSVLWMRFIQKYQKAPDKEIWVFEGKDDITFYSPRIERFYGTPPQQQALIAEGKENCLLLRNAITNNNSLQSAKVAFFIDRDFDDPQVLLGHNTYITPTYSIENLYYEDCCIERLLIEKLHLFDETDSADLHTAITKISHWRDSAASALAPYCAVLFLLREKDDDAKKLATYIKEKLLTDVLSIKYRDGEVAINSTKAAVPLCLEHEPPVVISEDAICAVTSAWSGGYTRLFRIIRGKFLLPHLHCALSAILEDAGKKTNQQFFSKRRTCSLQLRQNELLHQLANFAYTPDCLKDFLEHIKTQWANESGSAPA